MLIDDDGIFPREEQMTRPRVLEPLPLRPPMRKSTAVDMGRVGPPLPESKLRLLRELAEAPAPALESRWSSIDVKALVGGDSEASQSDSKLLRAARKSRGASSRRGGIRLNGPESQAIAARFRNVVELHEEGDAGGLDASWRDRLRRMMMQPSTPQPGVAAKQFGSAARVSEKVRAAAWQQMDEEAPEESLAPLRVHARDRTGAPAASGLSTWALRSEVLGAERVQHRQQPTSFEEQMALELQRLNLRVSSAGWAPRVLGDRGVDAFEAKHKEAARRGLGLLGTGRLARAPPSRGPRSRDARDFDDALDTLRYNRRARTAARVGLGVGGSCRPHPQPSATARSAPPPPSASAALGLGSPRARPSPHCRPYW